MRSIATSHCCDRLVADLNHRCALHEDRMDCPDAFIVEMNGGYGLIVHDGGSSAVVIDYCPWCGGRLPTMDI